MPSKTATPETTTYATVDDVQALAPSRKLGQGANPTRTDVQVYIELVEGEINGILVNKGYTVPISKTEAPLAYQMLRRITAQGAVAQLEASAGNGPNRQTSETVYQASLTSLMQAREIMDAAQNTERARPRGPGVTTTAEPSAATGWEGISSSPLAPYFTRHDQF